MDAQDDGRGARDSTGTGSTWIQAEGIAAGGDVTVGTFLQLLVQQTRGSRLPSPARCPYPGLRPFTDEEDEGWGTFFHGRARETREVLDRMVRQPVSSLVGPSGSGKSSLLHAGVRHQLRSRGRPGLPHWTVGAFVPGERVAEQLADALRTAWYEVSDGDRTPVAEELRDDPALFGRWSARLARATGGRVAWLVDQFEELLRPTTSAADRRCVEEALLSVESEAQGTAHVLIAFRADLYHRLESSALLARSVAEHQYWLPPLIGAALRDAVRLPAQAMGVHVEKALVERIVQDAGDGAGSLPLIAYALERLWDLRTPEGELTLAAYQQLGGIGAVLDEGALGVWRGLDPEIRPTARRVFTRLAHLGAGERPTRHRASAGELVTEADREEEVLAAVRPFIDARFLLIDRGTKADGPTLEVAHEVLLEKWQLLRGWLYEDVKAKRLQDEISVQARRWRDENRDPGFLLPPGQLRGIDELTGAHWSLNATEHEFVEASRSAEESRRRAVERAAQAERAEQRREEAERRTKILRRWRALTLCGLVLAVAAGAVAFRQERLAAEAKTTAEGLRLAAQARSAGGERRDAAALIALAGVRTTDTQATRDALVNALAEPEGQLASFVPAPGGAAANALAPALTAEGAAVLGCSDGTVRLVDPITGREVRRIGGRHDDTVTVVGVTAESGLLLSGDEAGTIVMQGQDARTAPVRVRAPSRVRIRAVAVDVSAGMLLSGDETGEVDRWRLTPGKPPVPQPPVHLGRPVSSIVVDERRHLALVAAGAHVVAVRTTAGGGDAVVADAELRAPAHGIGLTFGPDRHPVAVDGTVIASWPGSGHLVRAPATADAPQADAIVADPLTGALYTGDEAGRVQGWALRDAPVPQGAPRIGPPEAGIQDLATDGRTLVALNREHRLVSWDLTGHRSPASRSLLTVDGVVTALAYGPGGTLAVGDRGGGIRLSGPAPGRTWHSGGPAVVGLAWRRSDTLLALTDDGALRELDPRTGKQSVIEQHTGAVSVRAGPDGSAVAAWRDGPVLTVAPDGARTAVSTGTSGPVRSVALGPRGELAVGVGDAARPRILLWADGDPHARPRELKGHHLYVSALAFSPDGRTLASGSDDRSIILWQTASGRILHTMNGHVDTVRSLVWGDGVLASGAEDSTIRLWDPATGVAIGRPLRYADGDVVALAASPDQGTLIEGSGATVVRWPFALTQWEHLACAFAGGGLPQNIWREYAPGYPPAALCS